MAERKRAVKQRRKERKNVPQGHVHIQATFNNTIITITDLGGAVISWGSAGVAGFKGSRKSTPYAAALSADGAARRAMEHGMRQVEVYVKGPGAGREATLQATRRSVEQGDVVGALVRHEDDVVGGLRMPAARTERQQRGNQTERTDHAFLTDDTRRRIDGAGAGVELTPLEVRGRPPGTAGQSRTAWPFRACRGEGPSNDIRR